MQMATLTTTRWPTTAAWWRRASCARCGATECSIAATVPRCSWTASARPPRCAPCASALRGGVPHGYRAPDSSATRRAFRAAGKTGTAQFSQDGIRYSRRILHGQHGGLRAGREAPLYHLRDHPHAPRGRQSLLRRPPRGSRGQAPGLPTSTTASTTGTRPPRGAERRALPPGADERGDVAQVRRVASRLDMPPRAERRPHRDGGARTPTARRW